MIDRIPLLNEDEFEVMLGEYEVDFRKAMKEVIGETDSLDDARILSRECTLPNYPELEHAYRMHGVWHQAEWDTQPTYAKLGRKVAGMMFSVQECFEKIEPPELSEDAVQGARWITKSDYYKVDRPKVKHRMGPTKTKILADSLEGLEPGYAVDLNYDSEDEARQDQALLGDATKSLGWTNGFHVNVRAYKSRLLSPAENGTKFYILTVEHLQHPVPEKRYKPRA